MVQARAFRAASQRATPLPKPSRLRFATTGLLLALPLSPGCSRGPAYGSDNAIIAVLDPALRERLEPVLRASLEREVLTTRSEPIFEVTFTTPEGIGEFRRWNRLVVIEPGDQAVLLPDLIDVPVEAPVTEEVHDKWALGQTIYVLAAPTAEGTLELVRSSIDSLFGVMHGRFIERHVDRMWASEPDSALARRLRDELGFSLLLPTVYRPAGASAPPDSRVWFNENPRRVVSLHWEPRPAELTPDTVLAVRRDWGGALFPGDSIGSEVRAEGTRLDGLPAVRIQGAWTNPSDVTGGLFVTYGVICGDRLVLLDGNLYAPDRNKYPYVIQFDRIFETFRCATGGEAARA